MKLTLLDELLSYARSDNANKRKWFGRKMRALPQEEQDRLWPELEALGVSKPTEEYKPVPKKDKTERPAEGKVKVIWTEEEWDRMTQAVWVLRKNEPTATLVSMVRRVQEQWLEDRRRSLQSFNDLEGLVERLTAIDEQHLGREEEMLRLKQRLEHLERLPTEEEVLQTLTDAEVLRHFGQRVLLNTPLNDIVKGYSTEAVLGCVPVTELMTYLFKTIAETLVGQQLKMAAALDEVRVMASKLPSTQNGRLAPLPEPTLRKVVLPKVTVVGLLNGQQKEVEDQLKGRARFHFVDKNRIADAIPREQDVILLAANFIGHSLQEQAKKAAGKDTKLVIHHGGIEMLVKKLDELLPKENK